MEGDATSPPTDPKAGLDLGIKGREEGIPACEPRKQGSQVLRSLGATSVFAPPSLPRAVARKESAHPAGPQLSPGCHESNSRTAPLKHRVFSCRDAAFRGAEWRGGD